MKMKWIAVGALLCIFFSAGCLAAEKPVYDKQYDALKLDRLERNVPESAREEMSDLRITKDMSLDNGINSLWKKAKRQFKDIFKSGLKCIVIIIAIAAMCAVASSVGETAGSASVASCVSVVGALAVTAAAAGSITGVIGMGRAAINDVNAFSKSLLPSLAAAVAATGSPVAATARYSATVLFSDVLITLISSVLLPLVLAYLAAATADAAIENNSLSKIAEFIRWLVSGALKILLTVFVAYITISGIVSSGADVVGAKTAKFAISGTVPVVGGVIADAAETVIAGAMVMKNAIGIFGMLTILSICITPFLTLAVNYFLFKGAAALSAPMCDARITKLVDNIGSSFGIILGMTGACALLMFLSILFSMYAVGAL